LMYFGTTLKAGTEGRGKTCTRNWGRSSWEASSSNLTQVQSWCADSRRACRALNLSKRATEVQIWCAASRRAINLSKRASCIPNSNWGRSIPSRSKPSIPSYGTEVQSWCAASRRAINLSKRASCIPSYAGHARQTTRHLAEGNSQLSLCKEVLRVTVRY
jgi:hypothetical protein